MEEWVDDETRLVLAFIKSKGELVPSQANSEAEFLLAA